MAFLHGQDPLRTWLRGLLCSRMRSRGEAGLPLEARPQPVSHREVRGLIKAGDRSMGANVKLQQALLRSH